MSNPVAYQNSDDRPRVAVVIGSGGIKPTAGIALFEFLDRHDIVVDLLVGCSGGSVLCAAIGSGCKTADCPQIVTDLLDRKLFTTKDYRSVLSIGWPWVCRFGKTSGILDPKLLRQAFRRLYGDLRLEDLRPRTLLQATDIDTGEGVVLSKGLAAEAVYASGAFFPAFPPLRIDDRWLGDGVYSSPAPVMEAVKRSMDVIITLDFQERATQEPCGFLDCLTRYIDASQRSLVRSQMISAIENHHHEIITVGISFDHTISLRDVPEIPYLLQAGREAVERSGEAILHAVSSFNRELRAFG
jgi:NTE family protein